MKLNKGQEEAVKHKNGPCMVLAPPGSGKTQVVTSRTKCLIEEHHVPAEQILVITFTRYAAREMRERFDEMTGGLHRGVTFGTFHGVFYGILKCIYGITNKNLLSEADANQLLREVLNTIYIESIPDVEDEEELVKELQQEIGLVKNDLYSLKQFHSKYLTGEEFAEVFRAYETEKKKLKCFDFDDMLVQCYALFKKKPDILKKWQEKFKYILIDEFQDINRVQYEVIRMLSAPKNNLFVVGDDDQSIYGFRGAHPGLMLHMKKEFQNLKIISLSTNYRSTEAIVNAASRVILHNDSRFMKRIEASNGKGIPVHIQETKDEMDESRYVAEQIQKDIDSGIKPGNIAVLYRAGIQARLLTEILSEHQIPFEMKEHVPNFYSHFIVRDFISYMKLASGKRDRHLFLQVMNRPLRYISRSCLEDSQVTFEQMRKFYFDKEWMQDIIDQFDVDLRMMERMAPYAVVQYIMKRIGYHDFLKKYGQENGIPMEQLEAVVKEFEERCKPFKDIEELCAHIENYTKEIEEQKKNGSVLQRASGEKVQLLTMHASKGLEFESVYIIHSNEGETPYLKAEEKEELEEERRMFYVAMTRAKSKLTISYLTEKNGNSMIPSRFVNEVLGKKIKYKKK